MKATKLIGNLVIEIDSNGFYAQGHIVDETDKGKIKKVNKLKANELLEKIVPSDLPSARFTINRDLLLMILAEMRWETEEFLTVEVYGEEKPIVIRGEEYFAILMPARNNGGKPLDIKKEAKIK